MKKFALFCVLASASLISFVWWKTQFTDLEPVDLVFGDVGAYSKIVVGAQAPGRVVLSHNEKKGWRVEYPVQWHALDRKVHDFLLTIQEYTVQRQVAEDNATDEKFGIDRTQPSVLLTGKQRQRLEIYLGDKSPVGFGVYSGSSGRPGVFLGSAHLSMALNKSVKNFIDKRIFNFTVQEISSGELNISDDERITFSSVPKGALVVTGDSSVDSVKLYEYLEALLLSRASDVYSTKQAEVYQESWDVGQKSTLHLRFVVGQENYTLRFRQGPGAIYGKMEGVLFKLDPKYHRLFLSDLSEIGSRRLFHRQISGTRFIDLNCYQSGHEQHKHKCTQFDLTEPGDEARLLQSLLVDLDFLEYTHWSRERPANVQGTHGSLALSFRKAGESEGGTTLKLFESLSDPQMVWVTVPFADGYFSFERRVFQPILALSAR